MKSVVHLRAWKISIIVVIIFALFILVTSYLLVSQPHDGTSTEAFQTLIVSNMRMILTPDPGSLKSVKINQSMNITVTLTTTNNQSILSQLQGHFDSTHSSLQQLLGNNNVACISASLNADPDQFNVVQPQVLEYPLNQQSVMWSWIVTPKQTGTNFFTVSFVATGKSACTANNAHLVGPYLLSQSVSYSFTVIASTSSQTNTTTPTFSWFFQLFNTLGLGTIVTGVLTTLLASFLTWLCVQQWERRKNNKKVATASKIPVKPAPPSPPKQTAKKDSRRSR